MKKQMMFKTKGMNQDLSVSAFNPEFSFENRNLRLSTNDGNTLMSLVNERGTSFMSITIDIAPWIEGQSRRWESNELEFYSQMLQIEEDLALLPDENDDEYNNAVDALLAQYSQYSNLTELEAELAVLQAGFYNELKYGAHYSSETQSNDDKYTDTTIIGTPIGTAILNHKLVVFTHGQIEDYIYVFEFNDDETTLIGKLLYHGDLNFDTDYPIETLVSYEGDAIQKVYWVDGLNQPRMINIALNYQKLPKYNNTSFDFVSTLKLEEEVKVLRQDSSVGKFASGVIQYAFTYYKLYGQESNIFYTSPLLYVAHKERGAAPDETVGVSFRITVNHVDDQFDYLRIYSIHRSSLNGTPIVKRVQDIDISVLSGEDKTAVFTDTGSMGDAVDPEELFYKGGKKVAVGTIEQKDGKLFMGNLEDKSSNSSTVLNQTVQEMVVSTDTITEGTRTFQATPILRGDYIYDNQLDSINSKLGDQNQIVVGDTSVPCGGFKYGNIYRLGVQFQHETGEWSQPFYIMDKEVESRRFSYDSSTHIITTPIFKGKIKESFREGLLSAGFKRVRGVYVFPEMQDRKVLCQGVICPTMYTSNHRDDDKDKDLYAQSSWFFRAPAEADGELKAQIGTIGVVKPIFDSGKALTYTTACSGTGAQLRRVEIQGNFSAEDKFKIDDSTVTFHSPDVQFNDNFYYLGSSALGAKHVGGAKFVSTFSSIDIQTETPTISENSSGFLHKSFSVQTPIPLTPSVNYEGSFGIVAGPFYDDYIVVDKDNIFGAWEHQKSSVKWMVYPWNKSGSLNNDIERPVNTGVRSAVLKKKVIANLRYATTEFIDYPFDLDHPQSVRCMPKLFSSDTDSIIKLQRSKILGEEEVTEGQGIYRGNINTILSPSKSQGMFFDFTHSVTINGTTSNVTPRNEDVDTPFESDYWWDIFKAKLNNDSLTGLWKNTVINNSNGWKFYGDCSNTDDSPSIRSSYDDLFRKKEGVRMKYKSTPHLVLCNNHLLYFWENWDYSSSQSSEANVIVGDEPNPIDTTTTIQDPEDEPGHTGPDTGHSMQYVVDTTDSVNNENTSVSITYKNNELPIVEIIRTGRMQIQNGIATELEDMSTIYGGASDDAKKANVWIPCGEPVPIYRKDENDTNGVEFEYSYGDTYFQRWDCLKTYAYTPEDINQIVEIGSFMLETYVNIDGRYDRNRGQSNNVNMGPQNFNLLNPVYSQPNNFFSYKILNTGNQINTKFPNQITWSRTKESGADIDAWTQITLASTLELDGDKGKVSKLTRLNDQLIAFQDRGISQILYNENVQIASTEGVPIEIANSEAVRGKRYLSDTIGCSNKWSLTNTPVGIYFMDSYDKSIYRFNGELTNLSRDLGFNSWAKREIPSANVSWNPKDFDDFVTYYDKLNQDVLFISKKEALAYSEKLNTFTSFYSYDKAPYFCNLLDKGIWISKDKSNNSSPYQFYRHQAGNYGTFFGEDYGYSITLIGNPEPLVSKIFTNLEFRACTNDEGVYYNNHLKFYLPFDTIETWNEYQHGESSLQQKNGHGNSVHYLSDGTSALQRKFRIWRCDIPRDNVHIQLAAPNRPREGQENDEAFITMYRQQVEAFNRYSDELNRGIFRTKANPLDRMTNPWIYIKLSKEPDAMGSTLNKTEIHDMVLTYFD